MFPLRTKKIIFFFHLPKTGGETFSYILDKMFLPRQIYKIKIADYLVNPFNFIDSDELDCIIKSKEESDIRAISGHAIPWSSLYRNQLET